MSKFLKESKMILPPATPTTLGANANDYDAGLTVWARISASTTVSITGLLGGIDGRVLILTNVGAQTVTITNQDAASAAANRVITYNGLSIVLAQDGSVVLVYDGTDSRWREISRLV